MYAQTGITAQLGAGMILIYIYIYMYTDMSILHSCTRVQYYLNR